MTILALDTTCEYLSVAVETQGRRFCSDRMMGLKHSEQLLPAIEQLMKDADLAPGDLDLIVCAQGPGSFTGLRIGMATAKGIAAGAEVPLVSVPSTDVYAAPHVAFPGLVVPVIDAKKAQVYVAVYRNGTQVADVVDLPPEDLPEYIAGADAESGLPVLLAGPHPHLAAAALEDAGVTPYGPWASAVALTDLGLATFERRGGDQDLDGPVYVRKSDAELGV